MRRRNILGMAAFAAVATLGVKSFAVPNYIGTPAPGIPAPGPLILTPEQTIGKEYAPGPSPYFPGGGNITVIPEPHSFDPHQVTAWDANPAAVPPRGMADSSVDYTPFLPGGLASTQIDALANHNDLFYAANVNPGFYRSVVLDTSALLFSVTSDSGIAPAAPVAGSSPILFERITPAGGGGGIWATPPQIAHAPGVGSPLPNSIGGDLDGLEVWGLDGAAADDSNRFSLNGLGGPDPAGVAVWAQTGGPAGPVTAMVTTLDIAILIAPDSPVPIAPNVLANFIDLDALMFDDRDEGGLAADDGTIDVGLDHMLFSIRPVDPDGPGGAAPLFDGGEIWDTDFTVPGTSFLFHGGHLWDTAYDVMGSWNTLDENVDGLEAVATIPEPAGLTALLAGVAGLAMGRTRKRRQ